MILLVINYIRNNRFVLLIVIAVTFIFSQSIYHHNRYPAVVTVSSPQIDKINVELSVKDLNSTTINFEDFDNVTGANEFIIPNIIHFIRFNSSEFTFIDYITLKAAMRNHKPDAFIYHTDIPDIPWTGKYWDWVCKDQELISRIKMVQLDAPKEVFGQPLNEGWRFFHGSDLGRIHVLMKYGGIYMDRDVYLIQSLNKYRNFEFVLNWEDGLPMGNQVFLAHKDARFLRRYLDTYKEYKPNLWYYNAGDRPTEEVLHPHPELIHRVKGKFGTTVGVSMNLYTNKGFNWRELDTIHLLINHRHYLDPNYNKTRNFNEVNIQKYDNPFGEMAREILNKP